MNELVNADWYGSLVEDCKAIITEAVFTSRWALVEGYWSLGQRIRNDENYAKYAKGSESFLQGLARNLGISERTLYYSVKSHEMYPDINALPEGKNISWNKLVTKYLPEKETEPKPKCTCPLCGNTHSQK